MYTLMDAHPLTLIIIMSSVMVTPFYLLATYVFSGASPTKGLILGALFLVWGAVMAWFVLAQVHEGWGPLGQLVTAVCWVTPSVLLVAFRGWVLSDPLDQRWLVGLQVFRVIGGVFLIEYARGNLPGVFAYPAGIGDIAVGLLAAWLLLTYGKRGRLPAWGVLAVLVLGVADFIGAIFFGTTSSDGPIQLFTHDALHDPLVFPVGMIPLFLVPYAIFFHTLSWLTYRQQRANAVKA